MVLPVNLFMSSNHSNSQRFGGIGRLYGQHAMEIFQQAHIAVIGIGGVGSWVVEALARSGVGNITLIDHDDISITNMNRQIHTLDSTIDQSKVDVMRQRIAKINPECQVHAVDDLLTHANCAKYFAEKFDYVVDAIDSVKHKSALIYYCKRNKIPIITTGGAGGLVDPTQIEIVDLSKTYNDPLAAKVRSQLRHQYGFTRNPKRRFGIECVYSTEQQMYPQGDGTVGPDKPGVKGVTLDCNSGYGSSSCVTAGFGFAAAARVLNKILARQTKSN